MSHSIWKVLVCFILSHMGETTAQSYFPEFQQNWPKATPESHGYSSNQLEHAIVEMSTDQGLPFDQIDLIMLHDGYDIFHVGNPYDLYQKPWEQRDWASCGRSLMTTLYGMIWKQYELSANDLNRPVAKTFNSPTAGNMDTSIHVNHLLGYTACSSPPGSEWHYGCEYFSMYKILRDLLGQNPKTLLQSLASRIHASWEPFEYWGHKQDVPFLSIIATPSEAARWGYLWLRQGNWNGDQIVDTSFVQASVSPTQSPSGGWAHNNEGLQIHLNYNGMWGEKIPKDAFAAFGAGGRVIFVCPSLKLVIAVNSSPAAYQKRDINGEQTRNIRNLIEPLLEAKTDG